MLNFGSLLLLEDKKRGVRKIKEKFGKQKRLSFL